MSKNIFIILLSCVLLTGCGDMQDYYKVEAEKPQPVANEQFTVEAYAIPNNVECCYKITDSSNKNAATYLCNNALTVNNFMNLLPYCRDSLSIVNGTNFYTIGFYTDGDYKDKTLDDLLHNYPTALVDRYVLSYITGEPCEYVEPALNVTLRDVDSLPCRGTNSDFRYYCIYTSDDKVLPTNCRLPISLSVLTIEPGTYLLIGGMQLCDDLVTLYNYCYFDNELDISCISENLDSASEALRNYTDFATVYLLYGDRVGNLPVKPLEVYTLYEGTPLLPTKCLSNDLPKQEVDEVYEDKTKSETESFSTH